MRYKTWRSRNDTHPHILCAEGAEAFESLSVAIRNLGLWPGGPEGDIAKLRLPYRILLNAEARGGPRPHIPASIGGHESPGTAPSQHRLSGAQGERRGPTACALRQKSCWRCAGLVATSADQVAQAQCALA